MTLTYESRLRAAVIAMRNRWFRSVPICARTFEVTEAALCRALLGIR